MNFIRKLFSTALRAIRSSIPVLIGLIAAVALILLWWLGPKWQYGDSYPLESLMIRWLITLGVLLVLAIIVGIAMYLRADTFQQQLQEEEQEKADPAKSILAAMRHQYQRVLSDLRHSIGRRNYIYALPWFMIIGAEGSGKTSLINRSGQVYAQTQYSKSKRRNETKLPYKIDWWIGEDAVLIDPDGELISGNISKTSKTQNDKTELELDENSLRELPQRLWDDFVQWLGNIRSRRPLNGAVLVIDLPGLINMKASDRKSYAIVLRNRLRDLIDTLNTRLPIYVVMSKFDLLDGFDTYFENYPRAEREKVFGFTFSIDDSQDTESWLETLDTQYGEFVDNLSEMTFDAIATAPDQAARNALFGFYRQLSGIQDMLVDFLREMLDETRYSTPALVRGVYLTSVYQQGIPHNVFVHAAAAAYDLPGRIEAAKPDKPATTFFSNTLFQRVIYPEAGLAGDNIRLSRQKKRIFWLNSLLASLIGVCFIGGWHYYYKTNHAAIDGVVKRLQSPVSAAHANPAIDSARTQDMDITGYNRLEQLNQMRDAIDLFGNYREKTPVIADMGLYQGNSIVPKIEATYLDLLATDFLPQLAVGLLERINRSSPGSQEKLRALRVYRIMQEPDSRTTDDPALYERNRYIYERNRRIVSDYMRTFWQKEEHGILRDERIQLLSHLDYAMALTGADMPALVNRFDRSKMQADQLTLLYWAISADSMVTNAQRDLRNLPTAQRVYESLKQTAAVELRGDINLRQIIGRFDLLYKNEKEAKMKPLAGENLFTVPGFFTAPVYKNYFAQSTEKVLEMAMIDEWVLGVDDIIGYSNEDKEALAEKIRRLYVNDYIDYWRRTLRQLQINEFADIEYAVKMLEVLSGPEIAPLKRLLEVLRENVDIYPELRADEGEALTDAQKEILKSPYWRDAERIRRNFASLTRLLDQDQTESSYYDELITALTNTYDYMAAIQSAPDRGSVALKTARDRFELDGADPIYVLRRMSAGLPEPLSAQVETVAAQSEKVILIKALQALEKKWDREIYSVYRERLADRYPFNPNSKTDASLEDFEELFGPEGRLSEFYQTYLKIFLENTDAYLLESSMPGQLESIWDIQNGFFDNRGALGIHFSVEPLALSSSKLRSVIDIDGQTVAYNHRPTHSSRLIWPNTLRRSAQSQLTLVDKQGQARAVRYRGPWSWFRLLEQATINGATDDMIDVTFVVGGGNMRYRIGSEKSNSPIIRRLFENFSLPRTLLSSRKAPEAVNTSDDAYQPLPVDTNTTVMNKDKKAAAEPTPPKMVKPEVVQQPKQASPKPAVTKPTLTKKVPPKKVPVKKTTPKPVVAKPVPKDGWRVQAVAFTDLKQLTHHITRLQRFGYPLRQVQRTNNSGVVLQALQLGPFETFDIAKRVRLELRAGEYRDAFLVEPSAHVEKPLAGQKKPLASKKKASSYKQKPSAYKQETSNILPASGNNKQPIDEGITDIEQ